MVLIGSVKSDSVANGTPPLRRFFGTVLLKCQAAEMSPATRYTLRHKIASAMKF